MGRLHGFAPAMRMTEGKGTSSAIVIPKKAGWPGRHHTAASSGVIPLAEGKSSSMQESKDKKKERREGQEGK